MYSLQWRTKEGSSGTSVVVGDFQGITQLYYKLLREEEIYSVLEMQSVVSNEIIHTISKGING